MPPPNFVPEKIDQIRDSFWCLNLKMERQKRCRTKTGAARTKPRKELRSIFWLTHAARRTVVKIDEERRGLGNIRRLPAGPLVPMTAEAFPFGLTF
jgi:hypothetical protein